MVKARSKTGKSAVPAKPASVVGPSSSAVEKDYPVGDELELHPREEEWREEMREELREELRAEVRNAVSAALRDVRPPVPVSSVPAAAGGASFVPFEVDEDDVLEEEQLSVAMKRIEASNRSNKYAIRLAGISKEGNRQQFLDMVELLDHLEKAEAALKSPELNWADITVGRDEIGATLKLVENRMGMIERIDAHPLSWPVATEFQRLKRAKTGDHEDEKLFQQAEKKVSDERKKREESAVAQRAGSARGTDRFHYTKRPGSDRPFFCFVRFTAVYL